MTKALKFLLVGKLPTNCFDCPFYTETTSTGYHGKCSVIPADQVYAIESACCWSDWAKLVRADLRSLFREARHRMTDLEAMIDSAGKASERKVFLAVDPALPGDTSVIVETGKVAKRKLPEKHRVSEATESKSSTKQERNRGSKTQASNKPAKGAK